MQTHAQSTNTLAKIATGCCLALFIAGTTIAGIQGSGFRRLAALGTITAVGDITVNGTTYSSAHAHVSVNGHAAQSSDLGVGQVVNIDGTVDTTGGTAVADEIAYVGDVRGVITAIDLQSSTVFVLHQSVRITDETLIYDGFAKSLSDLEIGGFVEVSGYSNTAGEWVASRVDVLHEDSGAQLRGTVSGLDTRAHTFLINSLLVDYADATVAGELAEGVEALVQGSPDNSAGTLIARSIGVSIPLGVAGEKGDLEGIITSFASAAEFELNGQRIVADEKTRFDLHGVALGPDVSAHVTGRFNAAGVLVADKIEADSKDLKKQKATSAKAGKGKYVTDGVRR